MATELSQETINELVVAAHHDLPRVKAMLAEQPELLNENAEWIETPLQAAAHVGNREIADYLLGLGAPLDICVAAMFGNADAVHEFLADNPEEAQATGSHNIPVMYFAAISGSIEVAEILHHAGSPVNVEEGVTSPLHGAAIFGQAHMAKWLLDHDANPYAKDYEGKTPLDRAQDNGHADVVALLQPYFEAAN